MSDARPQPDDPPSVAGTTLLAIALAVALAPSAAAAEVAPSLPHDQPAGTGGGAGPDADDGRQVSAGALGVMRIDGKGRGIAAGFGVAYMPHDSIELELAALRSSVWGAYGGLRIRFMTGWVRPYAAAGVPLFFFTDDRGMSVAGVGGRVAGGVELLVSGHLSVEADLGIEHFFNVQDETIDHKQLDETVFVPTIGVVGRL